MDAPSYSAPYRSSDIVGVAVNGDGSVIVAGSANCDLDLGGGALVGADCSFHKAFVAKFDPSGAHLWSRLIEGSIVSEAVSLGVDALGNAFVAGNFTGTLDADGTVLGAADGAERRFLVRLDGDGHISRSQTLGPELSKVVSLAVGPEGNITILGQDASATTPSATSLYSSNGNIVTKINVAAP
jgi:hypothetical protein